MERLARALSVIQQGMLRNNPGFVKDSVNEAAEVLSGMLNTHKCILESGVEIQKRLAEREGWYIAILRCGHQRRDPKKRWGMAAGGKEEDK